MFQVLHLQRLRNNMSRACPMGEILGPSGPGGAAVAAHICAASY